MNTREVGTVLWFNNFKGFGYIKRGRDKKDFFVHFKNIRSKGYRSLEEGQNVTFFIKRNERDHEFADDVIVFDPIKEAEAKES
jgi:CspA family cold shock protein